MLNGLVLVALLLAGEADTASIVGFIALAAAVAEMPAGYDQLMKPVIENIPALIVALILTFPIALLSMRLAEKVVK